MSPRPRQRLGDLLAGIVAPLPPAPTSDALVRGLTLDSRKVRAGDAFVALRGGSTHGIAFAPAAAAQGASVILSEAPAPAAFQTQSAARRDTTAPVDGASDSIAATGPARVESSRAAVAVDLGTAAAPAPIDVRRPKADFRSGDFT